MLIVRYNTSLILLVVDFLALFSSISNHTLCFFLVQDDCEKLTRIEVEDTGKPIWEARYDILGCADALEFFGGIAPAVKAKLYKILIWKM